MEIRDMLEQVKNGELSPEDAEKYLKKKPFEELGFAKLDSHRETRSGFPEVVFCCGKPDSYLTEIYRKLYEETGQVFGTRADKRQYELVREAVPGIVYDEISHILKSEKKNAVFLQCPWWVTQKHR